MRSCTGCSSVPSSRPSESLQHIWYRQSPPPWSLRLLSVPFAAIARARASAYTSGWLRQVRIPKPVIVVGNLSVGGTGKTPLVIWLVEQLRAQGLHPGVVLRGYGGAAGAGAGPRMVQSDGHPADVGDEALLLRRRTGGPVAVGRDRVAAAQRLVDAGADVIVADDGLQHLRLARDHEIVVIDAARGLGNGYLLPAGPLREPPSRLARVDAVVVNGEGAVPGLDIDAQSIFRMRLTGSHLLPLSGTGEAVPLATLAGKRVHAVAGIGNPQRFFAQLAGAGLIVIPHPFPDHHGYRPDELAFADGLPLLMTEKDAVKCHGFAADNCWYLPVAASFAPQDRAALLAGLQPVLKR
jgi:tetraacyldisaccharide 4'-kinase